MQIEVVDGTPGAAVQVSMRGSKAAERCTCNAGWWVPLWRGSPQCSHSFLIFVKCSLRDHACAAAELKALSFPDYNSTDVWLPFSKKDSYEPTQFPCYTGIILLLTSYTLTRVL